MTLSTDRRLTASADTAGASQIAVRPQLLVSVRDEDEIAAAIEGGVDIVDLKEPRRGPLAPTEAEIWDRAADIWSQEPFTEGRPALSAALGEQQDANAVACRLPPHFDFAKVGPSGCVDADTVQQLWTQTRGQLQDSIELVAVAYADHHDAGCLSPEGIFKAAIDAGFARCLIDTFVKDGRSTIEHLGIHRLSRLAHLARESGIWWALAGSISLSDVQQLHTDRLLPDCFGVRGAVCRGGRESVVCRHHILRWRKSLPSSRKS